LFTVISQFFPSCSRNVVFVAPPPGAAPPEGRALYITLASVATEGSLRYMEDRVYVRVAG
jgi:hypothetical protein